MVSQHHYPSFLTATILEWKHLLKPDKYKNIIVSSLDYLVAAHRISVYGFVIMTNHIHLIWRIEKGHSRPNVQRDFLKFTAQLIQKDLRKRHPLVLNQFKTEAKDRHYQIWERNALSIELYSERVLLQKLNYMHHNPVRAGLVAIAADYKYSSAAFYEGQDKWPFLQHYAGCK